MSLHTVRNNPVAMSLMSKMAYVLIFSFALWSIGAPSFIKNANAAQVTNFRDILSSSNNSTLANHTIQFTATNNIAPQKTVVIELDPGPTGTSAFSEVGSAATSTDITFKAGATTYSVVSSCTAGDQVLATPDYNNGSNENLTLTHCSAATLIATSSIVTINVGTSTKLWTNPATTGSYIIRLSGTSGNTGDTQVAILPNVTVTASVDTSFTFTVAGLATSTQYNGITTTGSSTATALPFNLLTPGASSTLGQTLSVTTNARNGFSVTVQEDQPLTSSTGATIDLFKDGATTSVPTAWTAPLNTLDQPQTYGHMGVSSDDSDEGGGEFITAKYAGNFDHARQVFSHTGPADGSTQNKGLAHVFYTIEIGTLQEAGNDYTNTLTYVATPTF